MIPERDLAVAMMRKLPTSIRISAYDFTIEKWNTNQVLANRRWGECSTAEMTMRFQQDMPTRVKALDTVLHEISHAVWWAFGVEDEDKEERTVNLNASGWTCVYRDNPWLLDWIKECVA